jgi:drug/metabolite transporter (DMT)-like permease
LNSAASTTSSPDSNRPGPFLIVLTFFALLSMWSFNYVAGKTSLRYIDGVTLGTFRIQLAALVILPFYFLKRSRTRLRARDIWTLSYLGFFLCFNQLFFTIGLSFTTSGHSAMILATGPVIILIFAHFLKLESLAAGKLAGMAIACVGVFVLATEQGLDLRHSSTLAGDLYTLLGTTSFAFFVVLGKKVARQYDSISMNTISFLASSILLLPLTIRQAVHLNWVSVPWIAWAGLFYMSAISSVAAYTLFYWLLRYVEASRAAAVNYLQPLGAVLVGAAFLNEVPTRHLLAGGALILLGVYLAERGRG